MPRTSKGRRRQWCARVLALLLLLPLLPVLAGCDTLSSLWTPREEHFDEPADRLYNEGLYLLNAKKDLRTAIKRFEEVDRQHPYSEWARKALIMSAYTYYQANAYDE